MKKIIATLLLGLMYMCTLNAQKQKDTLPPYLKNQTIPDFKIAQTNDTLFEKKNLPEKTPLILIYFDPECSHCQMFTKDLTDSFSLVNKACIVMACNKNVELIRKFQQDFKLKDFENIVIGKEVKYFLPSYYQMKIIPFVAVYNKYGKLVDVFRHGISIKRLNEILNEASHKN